MLGPVTQLREAAKDTDKRDVTQYIRHRVAGKHNPERGIQIKVSERE